MAEEEKEEEPKKGGLMRIIMMVLGVLALIGVGIGAGYFLFGGKPADPSQEIEEIIERKMKEAEAAKAEEEAANAGPQKKEAPEVVLAELPVSKRSNAMPLLLFTISVI